MCFEEITDDFVGSGKASLLPLVVRGEAAAPPGV